MLHRWSWALLMLVVVCHGAVADQVNKAKYADIKRLIEVTGSADVAEQFAAAASQQIFHTLKITRPDIPDRALAVIDKELVALFSEKVSAPGGLIDQIIPVYDKYFTGQEIKELLAFYQSPTGRKTMVVLPKVTNETMEAGQRFGQSLGPEIQERAVEALKREGMLPLRKQADRSESGGAAGIPAPARRAP
jgi:hypothetical protein